MSKKPKCPELPEAVKEFFKKTGAQGGKARAERHSREQLREWGKKGGRPRKTSKAQGSK